MHYKVDDDSVYAWRQLNALVADTLIYVVAVKPRRVVAVLIVMYKISHILTYFFFSRKLYTLHLKVSLSHAQHWI